MFILEIEIQLLQSVFFNLFWDGSVKKEKGTCGHAEQIEKIETLSYSFLVFVCFIFSLVPTHASMGFLHHLP